MNSSYWIKIFEITSPSGPVYLPPPKPLMDNAILHISSFIWFCFFFPFSCAAL